MSFGMTVEYVIHSYTLYVVEDRSLNMRRSDLLNCLIQPRFLESSVSTLTVDIVSINQ